MMRLLDSCPIPQLSNSQKLPEGLRGGVQAPAPAALQPIIGQPQAGIVNQGAAAEGAHGGAQQNHVIPTTRQGTLQMLAACERRDNSLVRYVGGAGGGYGAPVTGLVCAPCCTM